MDCIDACITHLHYWYAALWMEFIDLHESEILDADVAIGYALTSASCLGLGISMLHFSANTKASLFTATMELCVEHAVQTVSRTQNVHGWSA